MPDSMKTSFAKLRLCRATAAGVLLVVAATAEAAPLIVTTTADGGAGSLRQAIGASPSGGSIEFNIPTSDPGYDPTSRFFTIKVMFGELAIGRDLTITGPTTGK